jgi:hypothetical protein
MPDAVGIDRFDYRPEAAPEGGEAEKEPDDAEKPPPAQDPPVEPQALIDVYFLCIKL